MKYDGKTNLTREGALIVVRFAQFDDVTGQHVELSGRMLIDTGSDRSLVSEAIPRQLGAKPIRYDEVQGVTGDVPERWPVFPLAMLVKADGGRTLTYRQDFLAAPIRAMHLAHLGLVGLDFLLFCNFVLDGPSQTFSLSFDEESLTR